MVKKKINVHGEPFMVAAFLNIECLWLVNYLRVFAAE